MTQGRLSVYRLCIYGGRIVLVVGLFGLWEWGARSGWISRFFFSMPSDILRTAWEWMRSGYIWPHFGVTLVEMLLGFAVGVVLGIAAALLLFFSPRLDRWLNPIFSLLNATPRAILYPLFVIWFGFGIFPKVAFAVSLVFFVVFFNTYQGLKDVDPDLVHRVQLLGGSRWDLLKHIYLPSVFLWVASSLRVSVSLAILGAVVGEYLSANVGIGLVISHSLGLFRAREVLAGLFLLLTVIALLDALLRRLELHFSRWRAGTEGGS